VEVLLKTKAFVVKRTASSDDVEKPSLLKKGQVTWSKFPNVQAAWQEAKTRAGFTI
jgi:hypothetical protein